MDKETDRVIGQYRDRLVQLGIEPDRIIAFCSFASGTNREDSGLDLLVVSPGFEKLDLWERMVLLGRPGLEWQGLWKYWAAHPLKWRTWKRATSSRTRFWIRVSLLSESINPG